MICFNSITPVDEEVFDSACQSYMCKLFQLRHDFIICTNGSNCFEMMAKDHLVSKEFTDWFDDQIPVELGGNRTGAIYLSNGLDNLVVEPSKLKKISVLIPLP